MKKAVICFTRVPRPGVTKTRLLPLLPPEHCAGLHTAFLLDLAEVYTRMDARLYVCHTPDPDWQTLRRVFPMAAGFFPQTGTDLGARMDHAICHVLSLGYDAVILTGTDLPQLGCEHLASGFSALARADITLGPTPDGGYYLVGAKAPCSALFTHQRYGGASVFENTLAAADAAGYTVRTALPCADVDTPDDLRKLTVPPHSHTGRYLALLRKEGIL